MSRSGLPVPNPTASYWLKDPSPLANHRTTTDLPSYADTIIIGSGITGAFAARFLKEASVEENVLMLEARQVCSGATGRNGGHLQPLLFISSSVPVATFELSNFSFLRSFIYKHNIPCDFVELEGGVHVFEDQAQWEETKALVERNKSLDGFPEGVELVEGRELERDGGRYNVGREAGVKGLVVQKRAGSLWPYRLVCWVLEDLCKRFDEKGFNLQTNTPVEEVKKTGQGWEVVTPRGTVKARRVLLATNAYTSALVSGFADLIVPVRGQVSALVPPRNQYGKEVRLEYSYGVNGANEGGRRTKDDYMVQRPPGQGELIFGGERGYEQELGVGNWKDDTISDDVARALKRGVIPPLEMGGEKACELDATFEWTGIMGYSRDDTPWVGEVPESLGGGKGLFVCGGYTGHGMPNAVLSAHAVVQMMNEDNTKQAFYTLPEEYVLSDERVRRTRETMATVQDQQVRGWEPLFTTKQG